MSDVLELVDLKRFQWSRPTAANPRLASPIEDDDTTIIVTNPPLDEDDKIIATAFLMGVKNSAGYTETILVPAAGVQGSGNAPDATNIGTTIAGVTRGINLSGLDYTTSVTALAADHGQDSPVFCNVAAFHFDEMISALQGGIRTGAENWRIGADADNNITVYAENGDANTPFWRYDSATSQFLYSNNGVDTTPFGTGAGVTGGDGITVTAGDIDVDTTDTTIFVETTAGAGDSGKVAKLDAAGLIKQANVTVLKDQTATAAEINQALDGISANVTDTNLNTMTAGSSSDASALHKHPSLISSSYATTTQYITDSEPVVASFNLSAGKLGTSNILIVRVPISDIKFVPSSNSVTIRLKYDGSVIASALIANTSATAFSGMSGYIEAQIINKGSASSQKGIIIADIGKTQEGTATAQIFRNTAVGTGSIDSTIDKTVQVAILGGRTGASANDEVTSEGYTAELLS